MSIKRYAVKIQEILEKTVFVEAEDFNTAVEKVENFYHREKIILTADDYCETEFVASYTFGKEPILDKADTTCFTNITAEKREEEFKSLVAFYSKYIFGDTETEKDSNMTHQVLDCFTDFVNLYDDPKETFADMRADMMSKLKKLLFTEQKSNVNTVTVSTPVLDILEWKTWEFISDYYYCFSGEEWKDDEPWDVIKTLTEMILMLLETFGTEGTEIIIQPL